MGKPNKQQNKPAAAVAAEAPVVDETLADALGLDESVLAEAEAAPAPESDTADVAETETEVDAVEPEADAPEATAEVAEATATKELVTDRSGQPRFKRRVPTLIDTTTVTKKARTKVATKKNERVADRSDVDGAHANARFLAFPTDKWGVTKDVKKSMVSMASRIGGDAQKYALAKATLEILMSHMDQKFEADKAYRESLTVKSEA